MSLSFVPAGFNVLPRSGRHQRRQAQHWLFPKASLGELQCNGQSARPNEKREENGIKLSRACRASALVCLAPAAVEKMVAEVTSQPDEVVEAMKRATLPPQ
jgi:hypothetical protein